MRITLNKNARGVLMRGALVGAALTAPALLLAGCPSESGPPFPSLIDPNTGEALQSTLAFFNTDDFANNSASYVGSTACGACHANIVEKTRLHAHSHALVMPAGGEPPEFPDEATRGGVPAPPDGFTYDDISYVLGGYLVNAFFIDQNGYFITNGTAGVDSGWLVDYGINGRAAEFIEYKPDQATPLPFDRDTCFRCHTTGSRPQSAENPRSQDNRPGIQGTWNEAGVRCEACHGPGSMHVPNPSARNIFVDGTNATCGQCHTEGDDPNVIVAANGFIDSNTQRAELRASGGHGGFSCTVCHDPHYSTVYDRENGLRNTCTTCHEDVNLAFHSGIVFEWGSYREDVTCESCHMPPTGLSAASADPAVVGTEARVGDVRGHIFRIDPDNGSSSTMFAADGRTVVKDDEGRAAVTLDFVCLRCHHGGGNAFPLTADGAPLIAPGMHERSPD